MKTSASTNAARVRVLTRAKDRLARTLRESANGKAVFICFALECQRNSSSARERRAIDYLCGLISRRLGRCLTLYSWLRANAHIPVDLGISKPRNFAKLQATRLAWIDSLIKEFS